MKFLFSEVALYLYKSTIWPCMEYCCHVLAGSHSWYLEFLDQLQKLICRTAGPSIAASLESLAHHRNVARLRYYATFKVRKVELMFCRVNIFLQKTNTCNRLQAEQIFSLKMYIIYIFFQFCV